MQHQHGHKRVLSAVELSWVRTLSAHSDDTTATLVTPATTATTATPATPVTSELATSTSNVTPALKAEEVQRRKIANWKSESEDHCRCSQHIESLVVRIDVLKHERASLLRQVQLTTEENILFKEDISHAHDRQVY